MDLIEAVEGGNRQEMLVALRDRLARQIVETDSGRDLAALSRQFQEVLREIASLPDSTKVSKADEIAAKREERRKSA